MAERRIAEKTGEGVIAFISNYSWLDGLSFTGMRERYLDEFDRIAIDCLNGDKYKTGKMTPEGLPDPSIFSTPRNPMGIQVGTAISVMVRKKEHKPAGTIQFRHLWGMSKRTQLTETMECSAEALYGSVSPELRLRIPFEPVVVSDGYLEWPLLPELLPVSFPGVKTSRDEILVDFNLSSLERRIQQYLDPKISDAEMSKLHPLLMKASDRFDPIAIRTALRDRNSASGKYIRYAYRPFDVRWLYWHPDTKLLDEKRPEYEAALPLGAAQGPVNSTFGISPATTISAQQKPRGNWQFSQVSSAIACLDLIDRGSTNFPFKLVDASTGEFRNNVSASMDAWLKAKELLPAQLCQHIVATLNAPCYATDNAGALRMDWPRIPVPDDADTLRASAVLGGTLSILLDVERNVQGVTQGALKAGLAELAVPRGTDRALTAGWGHAQVNKNGSQIVMPGSGHVTERAWTRAEHAALHVIAKRYDMDFDVLLVLIGPVAIDVQQNNTSKWEAVPSRVWEYTLGGYQVLKKWLSYREQSILGRALEPDEVLHFTHTARRITEILCMGPALDVAHYKARKSALPWADGKPANPSTS